MPFNQSDVSAAAQQAASTMKSATENMAKAGSEMMQQLFAQQSKAGGHSYDPAAFLKQMQDQFAHMPQMPNMDMDQAQKKFASYAREASEQMNRFLAIGAARVGRSDEHRPRER